MEAVVTEEIIARQPPEAQAIGQIGPEAKTAIPALTGVTVHTPVTLC